MTRQQDPDTVKARLAEDSPLVKARKLLQISFQNAIPQILTDLECAGFPDAEIIRFNKDKQPSLFRAQQQEKNEHIAIKLYDVTQLDDHYREHFKTKIVLCEDHRLGKIVRRARHSNKHSGKRYEGNWEIDSIDPNQIELVVDNLLRNRYTGSAMLESFVDQLSLLNNKDLKDVCEVVGRFVLFVPEPNRYSQFVSQRRGM